MEDSGNTSPITKPKWVDPVVTNIIWEKVGDDKYFMGVEMEEPEGLKAVGIVDKEELEYFKNHFPNKEIKSKG